MLPDQPPTFRAPEAGDLPWWWRLEDSTGAEVAAPDALVLRFPSQADAESWVGESWRELLDAGATAVTLHEHDRVVYGPMSLEA